jgi:hypothetical protein
MTRVLAWMIPVCALIGAAIFYLTPAWGQEAHPYTCLPAGDADAVHNARGDVLLAHRREAERIMFLWQKPDGRFFIVAMNLRTGKACIVQETPYDPRESVTG